MKTITTSELGKMLRNLDDKHVTFIGLTYMGPQRILNKGRGKNSMIEKLGIDPNAIMKEKVFSWNGGSSYETRVKNKNGDDVETQALGDHYTRETAYVVKHNFTGADYLTLFDNSNNKPKVRYMYKGKEINVKDSKFDEYRKPKKAGNKYGVEIRFFRVDRILEIRIEGEEFVVAPE